jgi:hypothetical protein
MEIEMAANALVFVIGAVLPLSSVIWLVFVH